MATGLFARPRPFTGGSNYDIDAREFLVSERNVVMRRTPEVDIRKFIARLIFH